MPLVSNRWSLTSSIRQYIICSCTTYTDEAMVASLLLLYLGRNGVIVKIWGQMKGGEVNGSVRFGTKIRQSIVIATFAAFVSLTSKLYSPPGSARHSRRALRKVVPEGSYRLIFVLFYTFCLNASHQEIQLHIQTLVLF